MLSVSEIRSASGDLAAWEKHLADPFSAESLQDPNKPFFVVGDYTFPDQVCVSDNAEHLFVFEHLIKVEGSTFLLPSRCSSNVCREANSEAAHEGVPPRLWDWHADHGCRNPDLTRPLHRDFAKIARRMLGAELYKDTELELTHERSVVTQGSGQLETGWHIDYRWQTILMGIISDVLPTQIMLNPTRPDDYDEEGTLLSVMGEPVNEAGLTILTLPPGKIAVVPMGMPHRGQIASDTIPKRNFMRWWVNHWAMKT